MKTIKTKLTQNGANLYIKGLLAGTVTGGICSVFMLFILSAFLLMANSLPLDALVWITSGIGCTAAFVSGYTCARITKVNGMIVGVCGGFIIFFTLFIAGVTKGNAITLMTLIKLILYTLCGAIGGIKGVNKKEKLHIK